MQKALVHVVLRVFHLVENVVELLLVVALEEHEPEGVQGPPEDVVVGVG